VSPERLWLLSIALQKRGHRRLARVIKKVNSAIYHNSLPPGAVVSPDISLGHHSFGTVIHTNVVIGRRVKIWQNVTIAVRSDYKSPYKILIEDDVKIGANSVVISPHRGNLRIGRGARIGAGAVVTRDVPAGSTVVSQPALVLQRGAIIEELSEQQSPTEHEWPASRADQGGADEEGPGTRRVVGLEPKAPDAGLGQVEPRQRAQEALRDDHMDPRLGRVVDPATEPRGDRRIEVGDLDGDL
jgi:serine O-acetyltransferase